MSDDKTSLNSDIVKSPSLISKARILVVDDDPEMVKQITRFLQNMKCEQFVVLTNGVDAIAYANNNPLDIIVMDFNFKNESRDGSAVVQEIQKFMRIPIVYMSGYSDDDVLEKIKSTKDSSFLQKPFSVEELKFSIELALYNHLEYALQKAEKRYRRIIETITDYIYSVKIIDGEIIETVHGDACVAVTGYTAKEFADNKYLWLSIVPESEQSIVEEHFRNLLVTCSSSPIEHRIIRKDGRIRWVSNASVFYYDAQGSLEGYDGIISDITNRKMAEEALIANQAALEEIIEQRTENLLKIQKELKEKQADLQDKNDKIEWHLIEARKTQELLLPGHNVTNGIVKVDYIYQPMEIIGGDFLAYAQFKEDEKKLGIFIGDVTGHGISASIYPSALKAFTDNIKRHILGSPKEYLKTLNHDYYSFVSGNMDAKLLTGLYGYFYQDNNKKTIFSFSTAGHPPPLVYRKELNIIESCDLSGIMIGLGDNAEFNEKEILLLSGDRIFLYTDGIIETVNDLKTEMDMEGFINILMEVNQLHFPITQTLKTILEKIALYRGKMPVVDDILLFMAEVQ